MIDRFNANYIIRRAKKRFNEGITREDELIALNAIKEADLIEIDNTKTLIIKSPHNKILCYTDRLNMNYDRLLILCPDLFYFMGDFNTATNIVKYIDNRFEINEINGKYFISDLSNKNINDKLKKIVKRTIQKQ